MQGARERDRTVPECRCTDEADDHVELLGRLHVLRLDPVDAEWFTASSPTREPKATVARIAIFAAASAPEMSSVGSASA